MLPLIAPGSDITFKKVGFNQLSVNDLVLFKQYSQLVCHRLIYRTPDYLITKGDNNLNSDGRIYPSQILGRLIAIKYNRQVIIPESLYLAQSTHYLQEIILLNRTFNKANLNYLFLKGLPLYLYYEKAHPKRFYADCDVLIDKSDLTKAIKILKQHGYLWSKKSLAPLLGRMKRYEPELVFYKTIKGFTVTFDLHQELVFLMTELGQLNSLYPTDLHQQLTAEALKAKRLIKYGGQSFPVLSAKHLVLYLGLHLFHHNFTGAFRYRFLKKVISIEQKRNRLQWRELRRLIKQYYLQNYLNPVFSLLKKYYQVNCPLYIKTRKTINIKYLDIFSQQGRMLSGLTRFRNLFWLSPRPFWRRLLVFVNPLTLATAIWVVYQNVFSQKFFNKRH